jgi:hypothetical protein
MDGAGRHAGQPSQAFQRPSTGQETVLVELRRLIATSAPRPGRTIVRVSLAALLGVGRSGWARRAQCSRGQEPLTYSARRG